MFRSFSRIVVPIFMLAAVTVPAVPAARVSHAAMAVPSWAQPYASTVTVNVGECLPSPIPQSMTIEDNPAVQYMEKTLNVKINFTLTAPCGGTWTQKVGLTLASGSMPDVLQLDTLQQGLLELHQLVSARMIQPLDSTLKYQAPFQQLYYKDDPATVQEGTVNGHLYAYTDTNIPWQYELLWVRQDWLNKLHLAPPKTLADIENIAAAFVKNKMGGDGTVGLVGPTGGTTGLTSLNTPNGIGGFDPIIQSFGAYQDTWIVRNGKVVYGSLLPGMKPALAELHKMYVAGEIDPTFVTHPDVTTVIDSNKAGLFFGPWWMPYYPLETSVTNDPKAKWVEYPAPIAPSGKLEEQLGPAASQFYVVRKGYAHPEIVQLLNNIEQISHSCMEGFYDNTEPYCSLFTDGQAVDHQLEVVKGGAWQLWPLFIQAIDLGPNAVEEGGAKAEVAMAAAIKAHNPALIAQYPSQQGYYKEWSSNPNPANSKELNTWADALARAVAMPQQFAWAPITHAQAPLAYYPTTTMTQYWPTIQKLEIQTFLSIIIGAEPLSAYDSWVSSFHSLGGDKITAELQAQYNS